MTQEALARFDRLVIEVNGRRQQVRVTFLRDPSFIRRGLDDYRRLFPLAEKPEEGAKSRQPGPEKPPRDEGVVLEVCAANRKKLEEMAETLRAAIDRGRLRIAPKPEPLSVLAVPAGETRTRDQLVRMVTGLAAGLVSTVGLLAALFLLKVDEDTIRSVFTAILPWLQFWDLCSLAGFSLPWK